MSHHSPKISDVVRESNTVSVEATRLAYPLGHPLYSSVPLASKGNEDPRTKQPRHQKPQ